MDNKIICMDNESKQISNSKSKFNLGKLLTGRNLKIVILIVVGIIAMMIVLSLNETKDKNISVSSDSVYDYKNTLEYCAEIENKLESVLSNIKGAGQVRVMVTVDGSPEIVYAKDEDEKTSSNSSGTTTSSSSASPIIITVNGNSNALILTENLPKVKGVIVVSTGANDVGIKLDILNAVSMLLGISIDNVSVLKGI